MRAAKRWILGISVFCALLPTEVFAAYKCWNPAICKAVCGAEICGKISASNRDMLLRLAVRAKRSPAGTSPGAPHSISWGSRSV